MMLPQKCPACKHASLSSDQEYIFCTNCPIYRKPLNLFQKPLAWATTRYWWWRLPILAWFASMLADNLHTGSFALNRLSNPFSAFDLGIHELGHILFTPFGEFMRIAGGSLFQCLFPLLWLAGFLQKKCYFAASLCFCWLGLNLFDVATYAADARARLLPLSGGPASIGVDPNDDAVYDHAHDWYQLLSRTHHLHADLAIAHGLRVAATIAFLIGLALAGTLLLQMVFSSVQRLSKKS
ncbi:MAG TPA: hypothetical protein VLI54_03815 [Bacillota bacterium]|nr:hypothetical protein [Bacillota bacterium]